MKAAIIGGGFAGVSAACALAQKGHDVTLIDPHGFLGGDVAAAQHTRIMLGGVSTDVPNGRTKMQLYARLKNAGVQVLLAARCAGILTDGAQACGVMFAAKYGVLAAYADAVIDATENGAGTYHLTGRKAEAYEAEYGFDVGKAQAVMEQYVPVPESLGLVDNRAVLTRTMKPDTVNVSFRFPAGAFDGAAGRTEIERRAHDLMIRTAYELRKSAYLAEAKINIAGSHTRLFYRRREGDARLCTLDAALPADFSTADLTRIEQTAAEKAVQYMESVRPAGEAVCLLSAGREIAGWTMRPWREKELRLMSVEFDPEMQEFERLYADAVIAGAGTGGAMAGWALRSRKADVLILDALYWCGGTNTVGNVYSAWHGYVDGMFAQRAREVAEMKDTAVTSGRIGAMRLWEEYFSAGGARFISGMTVCGAVVRNSRIEAALVCGEEGFALASGKIMIDGTADGDLCALAGAEFAVGGVRDGFVQTSSMWGHEYNPLKTFVLTHSSIDQDVIDPDSYADLLRGLGLGYRGNSEYEIVEMCMQRESRRFDCRKGLTMAGIARREVHEDDIAVGLCIHDTHGRPSSLMNTLNLFGRRMKEGGCPDIRIRMPLGMFLPRAFDNAALVGKSMCGEREAVALCRMNPDISNSAYAVGLAAAYALEQGVRSIEDVDLAPVQEELRALRVLPEWAARPADRLGVTEAMDALDDPEDGGFSAMVQPKERIVPLLLGALAKGGIRALNAAMALAWHGEAAGSKILTDQLKREIEKDAVRLVRTGEFDITAVRADGFEKVVNPHPNYGWVDVAMGDPDISYSRVNRLAVLIGLAGGDGLDEVLEIVRRTQAGPLFRGKTPYSRIRIDTHRLLADERVFALTAAIERLADRRACADLERLMDDPDLNGQKITELWGEVTPPRCALLEINTARAAAHCGSRKGAMKLIDYLSDPRKVFSKMARRALIETLSVDMGEEEAAWMRYVEGMDELPVTAYRGDPYGG